MVDISTFDLTLGQLAVAPNGDLVLSDGPDDIAKWVYRAAKSSKNTLVHRPEFGMDLIQHLSKLQTPGNLSLLSTAVRTGTEINPDIASATPSLTKSGDMLIIGIEIETSQGDARSLTFKVV